MKLESHTSSTITTETYQILTENHGPVTYIEYLNDKGKVIDCNLRDEDGNDIIDPALLEEIQEFIDNADEQQRRDEKNGLYGGKEDIAN
jgi:hypothetical protein